MSAPVLGVSGTQQGHVNVPVASGPSITVQAIRHPLDCDLIFYQDACMIDWTRQSGRIDEAVCSHMIIQLANLCGTQDQSPFIQARHKGAMQQQYLESLAPEQFLLWLRHDLIHRRRILETDEKALPNYQRRRDQNIGRSNVHLAECQALEQRMNINRQQLTSMTAREAEVCTLIEQLRARQATVQYAPEQRTWIERTVPPKQLEQKINTPARTPLVTISGNLQRKESDKQTKSFKRKRDVPKTNQASEVISLVDSSDDEEQPQSHVDALQAKIAAIRSRNAREDEVVAPAKKHRKTLSAGQKVSTAGPAPDNRKPQSSQLAIEQNSSSVDPMTHAIAARITQAVVDIESNQRYSQPYQQNVSATESMPRRNTMPGSQPAVDLTSSPPSALKPQPTMIAFTEPDLCKEQQEVVDLIMAGHNVFYTGSAGCGKSTVLKAFVPRLRGLGKTVRIVAPTGRAALDINGSTTWTFAGWTPLHMKKPLDDLKRAAHGKFVTRRMRDTDVLVIDEISMVENHIFERLNAVMKAARGNEYPFGGVQLVVTGDFCQLPPVKPFQYCITCGRQQGPRTNPHGVITYKCFMHGESRDVDKWAFRSAAWEECVFKHVNLTNIHRQSDEVFIRILQRLRLGGGLTDTDRKLLLDHPCDVQNAVKLFPTREEVRRINQAEFEKLTTAKHQYTCLDFFSPSEKHPHLESKGRRIPFDGSLEALREHKLDVSVEFKQGMLVVLLVNLDIAAGLVNGSQGRIVGFEKNNPNKLPKARHEDSTANSIFSGRGSKSGRGYAGSGVDVGDRSDLRGEYAILREEQIRSFMENPRNTSKQWPIVEFDNGVQRTIYADCRVNELGDEKPFTLLARTQIPLIAAWAMTIHKSQGMTLNRVIVDLGKSFEEGQDYVALSRARSLDGLKVVSLSRSLSKGGNEQVKDFLKHKFNLD